MIGKAMAAGDPKTGAGGAEVAGGDGSGQAGPTDPEEVVREQELERMTKEFEEKKKKLGDGGFVGVAVKGD